MLSIQNVTKTFGGCRALDGLTMTVPRGAVYGLVGPNGAGKSTLIRCAAGVYRPDAGTITLDGAPVYENPAAKARIGYIPDDVFHFPSASIRDMASFYRGVYRSFDDARFAKLREAFALDEKQPIRRMSKGMQKQAAFWLTLSMRPELLILDEPVDGLDPVMRRQVWGIVMGDAAEYGTTVLVASHNLRELEDVCDHVGVLDHGRLLLERSLAALQSGTVKALVALPEGAELPQDLPILHESAAGRMRTLILRADADTARALLTPLQPQFLDVLPLNLEEVFIYELGGADYAVKDILL